jgi:pimeloyl-ACP methyl ester carboxylesterase
MAGPENLVVLMLHGFLGSPQNWRACAEVLSARWRVLVPQLPIFSGPAAADRQEHVLRFLVDLIVAEPARRVVVLGNSYGGQLALHLAQRQPDRVGGLVLTGSGGLYQPKAIRFFYHRPEREWMRGYIQKVFYDESLVTEAMVDEVEALFNNRKKLMEIVRLAKTLRKNSVRELLPQVRCPVRLIWGAEDKVTPPATAQEFQQLLPDAELHFIPRCGHAPMMEQPAEFNRLVEEFLQRVPT